METANDNNLSDARCQAQGPKLLESTINAFENRLLAEIGYVQNINLHNTARFLSSTLAILAYSKLLNWL